MPSGVHDTELTSVNLPLFRAARPGTPVAVLHLPFRSTVTNPWLEWSPPAAQLLCEPHDTDRTWVFPPVLRAARPGTSIAVAQAPFRSATANPFSLLPTV